MTCDQGMKVLGKCTTKLCKRSELVCNGKDVPPHCWIGDNPALKDPTKLCEENSFRTIRCDRKGNYNLPLYPECPPTAQDHTKVYGTCKGEDLKCEGGAVPEYCMGVKFNYAKGERCDITHKLLTCDKEQNKLPTCPKPSSPSTGGSTSTPSTGGGTSSPSTGG